MTPIRFGTSLLRMLSKAVTESPAIVATERGTLYLLPHKSLGAIRLNVAFPKYLEFLGTLNPEIRPKDLWLVPVENQDFQIVVYTLIEVRDGKTFVDGREVVFL